MEWMPEPYHQTNGGRHVLTVMQIQKIKIPIIYPYALKGFVSKSWIIFNSME
jgi:hypothetical protein